ncbi:5'/3'-nucleotidase SurE [bacterium]|nr:5'/3'-nucleotidase SurE [bacterium]
MNKPYILLVNDDGIHAPGLAALVSGLANMGELVVVAPSSEMSAVGHGITLSHPLRVKSVDIFSPVKAFAVTGTPADCIKIACNSLLDRRPDIIVSGINSGSNTGINAIYSGTVAAAAEGAIMGIPSCAVSLTSFSNHDFRPAARWTYNFVSRILECPLPKGVFLNINIPAVPEEQINGFKLCRQGQSEYKESYEHRIDPHGGSYYWLSGQRIEREIDIDIDEGAIQSNYVAVTPLHVDLTQYDVMKELLHWDIFS